MSAEAGRPQAPAARRKTGAHLSILAATGLAIANGLENCENWSQRCAKDAAQRPGSTGINREFSVQKLNAGLWSGG